MLYFFFPHTSLTQLYLFFVSSFLGRRTRFFAFVSCSFAVKICPIDCDKNQDWIVSVDLNTADDEIGTLCVSKGTEEDAKRSGEKVPTGYTRSIIGSFNTGENDRIALGDPCAFSDDWYDSDSALFKMKKFNGTTDGVYFSTNHCDGMYPVICLFENQAAQMANKPTSFRVTFTQPCHNALCDALGMP